MWFVEEQRKTKLSSKHSQSHLPHSLLYGWVLKFNCLQVNQQSNSINCEVFVVAIVFTFVLDCHQMKAVTMLLKCATTCQPVCNYRNYPLRKKCPHSVLFWSIFSRICTEYEKMRTRITLNTETFHTVITFSQNFKDVSTLKTFQQYIDIFWCMPTKIFYDRYQR